VQFEYVDLNLVKDPARTWTAHVAFIKDPSFQMVFQGLLGTEGFLDKWAVTFNKYYDYFEIRPPARRLRLTVRPPYACATVRRRSD